MFFHVVNFWLNEDISADDKAKFVAGVSSLGNIETAKVFNVGTPADTNRPIIDRSYDYCLLTAFDDLAGHDVYQVHPIHLKFVDECKHLWKKILIYDSVSI
jgi:Stress responsive A/B Barrel Domain